MAANEDHLLQTSALINEAYLRLIDWKSVRWQNRAHFFGVAAQMMRRILVDFARRRPRNEQGVEARHISLGEALTISTQGDPDLLALDEALDTLATVDERKSKIVELRFFGGLSVDETAAVMKLAPITVIREWNKAKAWLYRELSHASRSNPELGNARRSSRMALGTSGQPRVAAFIAFSVPGPSAMRS